LSVTPDRILRISLCAGIGSAIAGLLVLTGWVFEMEVLKRVQPGFTSMNPMAACCFVVGGLAMMAICRGWLRPALILSALVAALASLKILDFTFVQVPVDRILFADRLGDAGATPSRMAPNTAIAFLLIGLSLAAATIKGSRAALLSQALGGGVLLISMFALIGYGFGMDQLHRVGPFIPMAIHTAVLLLILSIGLFSLAPEKGIMRVLRDGGAAGSLARTILPLALLIPVAVGAMRLWGQEQGYYGTEAGIALQVVANVLVTSALLISSIVALYHSDSGRRRREQALARSEARYRLAETVASVGHWRMDLPSLGIEWSDELFRICGIDKKSGAPSATQMLELYHPDDRGRVRESVRAALREGRDWQYRVRLCRPDGDLRHVSSQGVCERDADGKLTSIFGVFADVTELERARCQAEAATAAKAAFLANMSHEIRTPLNGVMGFAELLLAGGLEPQQKRHATLILDSAQVLLKLLNDILDVSKIDAGQLEVAAEPLDLGHQLRQCVRLMESPAQKKGLALSLSLDPTLPRHIVGDGLRIRQVILNLLGNAVKFTDRGSVAVVAAESVSLAGVRQLQIKVTDTGVGIPPARQASVFEEFVQADASISRRFGGSGLGLSISRRLIALMGGNLALASQEGVGTQVTVTLPLHASEEPAAQSPEVTPASAPSAPAPQDRHACILLVEDLDINQELITGMLSRMGYRVEIAANGAEAIREAERLNAEPGLYDLIFMDVQMPAVDGLTATRAIRSLGGSAASIPIVALTANAFASEIEECREAGMNDHLSKPVSMAALGAALTHWLPAGQQGGAEAPETSGDALAGKFAERVKNYAQRLEEIRAALGAASDDARAGLLAEASTMAHNLAGTAAMFGHPNLGEVAAATEDRLDPRIEAARTAAEAPIEELLNALKKAA
jgi:PAS domain S-box-containing protein